jgi:hypothetical protein
MTGPQEEPQLSTHGAARWAATPSRVGRRYLPFIALAAVQVLLVAVAPSSGPASGPGQQVASSGGFDQAGNPVSGDAAGTGSGGGAVGSAAAGGPASAGASSAAGSGQGGASGAADDLSKCNPRTGRQIGPLTDSAGTNWILPHCRPVFHGTNGGATMTGVTPTAINYVSFQIHGDPTFNAVVGSAGLQGTPEQWCEEQQAFRDAVQKRWELWGRKLVSLDGPGANKGSTNQSPCHYPYFQSQCTAAPPDEPCFRAEAKVIASMKPAVVLAETQDPALYDELTKNHILVIATATTPVSVATYQQAAPYLYGAFMDGTRMVKYDAEYWCAKLNGKPVSHAGADVTTARNWGPAPGVAPTRKVGVLFPETAGDTSNKVNIDLFAKLVSGGPGSMCNSPGGVFKFGFASDASQATTQSNTAVNALIQNHITTVMCWCDPVSPVFLTNAAKANGYFPEHLLAGQGLMDADQVARLYEPSEWAHAFGVSSLYQFPPFAQSDATRAWQDAGNPGQPATDAGLYLLPFMFMGDAFMEAGPSPTVDRIHQGLVALGNNGGWAKLHDPHVSQWGLDQQSPWTFEQDVREVYWSPSRTAEVDGKPGSYCPVAAGRRYNLGGFAAGGPDVFDSAANGC